MVVVGLQWSGSYVVIPKDDGVKCWREGIVSEGIPFAFRCVLPIEMHKKGPSVGVSGGRGVPRAHLVYVFAHCESRAW